MSGYIRLALLRMRWIFRFHHKHVVLNKPVNADNVSRNAVRVGEDSGRSVGVIEGNPSLVVTLVRCW